MQACKARAQLKAANSQQSTAVKQPKSSNDVLVSSKAVTTAAKTSAFTSDNTSTMIAMFMTTAAQASTFNTTNAATVTATNVVPTMMTQTAKGGEPITIAWISQGMLCTQCITC